MFIGVLTNFHDVPINADHAKNITSSQLFRFGTLNLLPECLTEGGPSSVELVPVLIQDIEFVLGFSSQKWQSQLHSERTGIRDCQNLPTAIAQEPVGFQELRGVGLTYPSLFQGPGKHQIDHTFQRPPAEHSPRVFQGRLLNSNRSHRHHK